MTPEDIRHFRSLGKGLLANLAQVLTFTLLYGVFVVFFCISVSIFLRKGPYIRPVQWAMFTVSIVSFIVASANIASQIAALSILIRSALVDNVNLPKKTELELTAIALFKPNMIALWTSTITPILSDGAVIWRAWSLFQQQRWIMILPLSLLLASISTAFTYNGLTSSPSGIESSLSGDDINRIFDASIALSMVTNVVSTALIAYRLWTHRKFIVRHNVSLRQSPAQRILFLLIESGVIYCSLQLIYLVLGVLPQVGTSEAGKIARNVFFATYFEISAMYPTIILVLVNSQRSFVDIYGLSGIVQKSDNGPGSEPRPATAGHLSFTVPLADGSATSTGKLPENETWPRAGGERNELDAEKGHGDNCNEYIQGRHVVSAPY